jgi:hypothetical protein
MELESDENLLVAVYKSDRFRSGGTAVDSITAKGRE